MWGQGGSSNGYNAPMQMRRAVSALSLTALVAFAPGGLTGAAPRPDQAQAPAPAPAATVVPAVPAKLDPAALSAKIDEYLQAQVKQNGFTGTVLLAHEGKPLFRKGYGFANVEWQIPNAPDTKFRIGSVTKQFTSMLVMLLREQGKVKLEDSLCVYLDPCPETWKPVTIHHLLTHTSGIPTYTGLAEWRKVNMVPHTIDQMIGFFRNLPLDWKPGEKYAYNNSGYFLLGVVIEKASGKKYEEALKEMILTPLGLKDTGYDWTATIIPKRAAGYMGMGEKLTNTAPLDMQQPYSAGSLYSTVDDLLKWDQALYTTRLLPDAAKKIMWTPALNNYAYGWNIRPPSETSFGYQWIAHSGGINGFSSMLIRIPDAKMTSIVLGNNGMLPSGPIAQDVLSIYFGRPYKMPQPPAKVSTAVMDRYVGEYELKPGFTITISRKGEQLMAQATGQDPFELLAESETKFNARIAGLAVTFVTGADGAASELILHQGGDRRAKKIR